jgi:hypothetical protein
MSQLLDIRQPVRSLSEDTVRTRYQETTREGIKEFMCAVARVIFRVCKLVRLLNLLVVMSCVCNCSINPVIQSKPHL